MKPTIRPTSPATRRRRWAAVALCASLVMASAPTTGAHTPTEQELEDARKRVEALQTRIEAGEAEVERLKQRLNALSAQVGREQAELAGIRTELADTNERLETTKARLGALRDRIRERARTVYMRGPTQILELILGSKTFSEFTGRVAYASRIAEQDNNLMLKVRKTEAELTEQQQTQQRLESEQRSALASVESQQAAVRSTFAAQLAEVSELAQARSEARALVEQLEHELAEELAGLRSAAGRGMTISYGQWAGEFLGTLGAPASRNNLVAVVAWEAAEGTQATWNPLATTKDWPGATIYNSHGVKNYPSKQDGIGATIATLELPGRGYEAIVASLKRSADPMETGRAINRSMWCRGCAGGSYVIGIIPAVEEYYEQYASR